MSIAVNISDALLLQACAAKLAKQGNNGVDEKGPMSDCAHHVCTEKNCVANRLMHVAMHRSFCARVIASHETKKLKKSSSQTRM